MAGKGIIRSGSLEARRLREELGDVRSRLTVCQANEDRLRREFTTSTNQAKELAAQLAREREQSGKHKARADEWERRFDQLLRALAGLGRSV